MKKQKGQNKGGKTHKKIKQPEKQKNKNTNKQKQEKRKGKNSEPSGPISLGSASRTAWRTSKAGASPREPAGDSPRAGDQRGGLEI